MSFGKIPCHKNCTTTSGHRGHHPHGGAGCFSSETWLNTWYREKASALCGSEGARPEELGSQTPCGKTHTSEAPCQRAAASHAVEAQSVQQKKKHAHASKSTHMHACIVQTKRCIVYIYICIPLTIVLNRSSHKLHACADADSTADPTRPSKEVSTCRDQSLGTRGLLRAPVCCTVVFCTVVCCTVVPSAVVPSVIARLAQVPVAAVVPVAVVPSAIVPVAGA